MNDMKRTGSYYDLLEVSPRARTEVIAAAYKALMQIYHPDRTGGNDRVAKDLNEAHRVLLDPAQRATYDEQRLNIIGTVIGGRYRVVEKIAEGGFGRTYKGEHTLTHKLVCIKQGHKVSPQDEKILFEEAEAVWDLRHYGIPVVRDILKLDDGSPALITSYIPGKILEKIVDHIGRLESEHVAWIAERAINVLKYLHYHGVVHGDVKPQNVIVQPEHQVVLVDYGLSAIRPTGGSSSKGYTPYFAPPEQVNGKALTPAADFYGLGMSLLYALGGEESVASKRVPSQTPDPPCPFLKRLIVRNLL